MAGAANDKDDGGASRENGDALKALNRFCEAEDKKTLWADLLLYAKSLDADLLSYRHRVPTTAASEPLILYADGFPDEWVAAYKSKNYDAIDPLAQLYSYRVRPARWRDVENLRVLDARQTEFMDDLRKWLPGDGWGIPAFGPNGQSGYVGIGRRTRGVEDWDILTLNRIQWVVQNFHLRWCELHLLHSPTDFSLTPREVAVLENIALGFSDALICGVVGAGLNSVQQSVNSLMKKMGVTDRPSAIMRGVAAGIIDPKYAPQ